MLILATDSPLSSSMWRAEEQLPVPEKTNKIDDIITTFLKSVKDTLGQEEWQSKEFTGDAASSGYGSTPMIPQAAIHTSTMMQEQNDQESFQPSPSKQAARRRLSLANPTPHLDRPHGYVLERTGKSFSRSGAPGIAPTPETKTATKPKQETEEQTGAGVERDSFETSEQTYTWSHLPDAPRVGAPQAASTPVRSGPANEATQRLMKSRQSPVGDVAGIKDRSPAQQRYNIQSPTQESYNSEQQSQTWEWSKLPDAPRIGFPAAASTPAAPNLQQQTDRDKQSSFQQESKTHNQQQSIRQDKLGMPQQSNMRQQTTQEDSGFQPIKSSKAIQHGYTLERMSTPTRSEDPQSFTPADIQPEQLKFEPYEKPDESTAAPTFTEGLIIIFLLTLFILA